MENTANYCSSGTSLELSSQFFLSCLHQKQQSSFSNKQLKASPEFQKQVDSGYCWRGVHLTVQKLRCLICLSQGLSPQQTAKRLGIAYSTLATHLTELRWRLRFSSKQEMIQELRSSKFGQSIQSLTTDLIHSNDSFFKQKK